jgi:hypothetical protein
VLTITLPKSEKAKPRQIAVETGGRGQQVQIGQNNQGSEGGQGNQGNQWTPEKERSSSRRSEAEKQSR